MIKKLSYLLIALMIVSFSVKAKRLEQEDKRVLISGHINDINPKKLDLLIGVNRPGFRTESIIIIPISWIPKDSRENIATAILNK